MRRPLATPARDAVFAAERREAFCAAYCGTTD
jgi:hypothetical protein